MTLISIRRPKLRLQALKVYRAPKYPRAGEELDFDLNDVTHWPFAPALASALLASTLVAGSGGTANAGEGTATVAATRQLETRSVPNPFGPKARVMDFGGKGGPMTLPKEMALVAIAKGFEKSGVEFESDVQYKKAGVRVELEGYDARKDIGFDWIAGRWEGGADMSLNRDEVVRLDKDSALGKRQIAAIYAYDARFTGNHERAAKKLTRAVQDYVDYLRSAGAL